MDFKEFDIEIRKARKPHQAKVRNSWGIYDSFKLIRKHGWYDIGRPLYESEYFGIVRNVNRLLADEIAEGHEVVFPSRMGKLEVKSFENEARMVNGKLRIPYPIDWDSTIKLWYEDEEARKNKILIRHECKMVYYIRYNKFDANYENQCFYQFAVNRFLTKAFINNLKKGLIDILW